MLASELTVCWQTPTSRGHARMNPSRCNGEEIIAILKEEQAAIATAELCRCHRMSSATFYEFKSKFGWLRLCLGGRGGERASGMRTG